MTSPASAMENVSRLRPAVPGWRRGRLAVLVLVLVLVILGTLVGVQHYTVRRLMMDAGLADQRTLDVYEAGIVGTLDRYPRSIVLLAQDPRVTGVFGDRANDSQEGARLLNEYAAMSGAASAFVLDRDGNLVAASDGALPVADASAWFAAQSAFQATLTGRLGRAFGPVPPRGERLYFYGRRIRADGGTLGMLVVAVAINELELLWRLAEREVVVADTNGIVVLSSDPDWRLQPTVGGGLGFDLPISSGCDGRLIGGNRLCQASRILHLDWDVYLLSPVAELERRGWIFASEIVLVVLSALLSAGFGWRRLTMKERSNQELQRRVKARTMEIEDANSQLRSEITSRITREQELRRAQDELVQSGKMAALGQMAAGLVHELNQPLAALRTYADNTSAFLARGNQQSATDNLGLMGELIDRMARISAQLKAFARRTPLSLEPVELQPAIESAVRLVQHATQGPCPDMATVASPSGTMVLAEPVRLQQVLVNLIRNGVDAVGSAGTITVSSETLGETVRIYVRDDGPGINSDDLPRLFDPFFTSKPAGSGLGLGLSVSKRIAEEFGGDLRAANQPDGGACFTFELRRIKSEAA